jgi:(S)-sulfolactate dehydrogenase
MMRRTLRIENAAEETRDTCLRTASADASTVECDLRLISHHGHSRSVDSMNVSVGNSGAAIVITEFMDPDIVEELGRNTLVSYDTSLADDRRALLAAIPAAGALIVRNRTKVDRELLERAEQIRVVGRLGVGIDNIDIDACRERGIQVRTAGGANATSVAEHVLGAMLCLSRPALTGTPAVIEGTWPRESSVGTELATAKLGLIGFGAIGRAVATRAIALGMSVCAHDPYVRESPIPMRSLQQLASEADVISVHVPLVPETRGLIGEAFIGSMRPGSLLIDCSRGGVVEHAAVVDALVHGHLRGAALDVFPSEPVTAEIGALYRGVPNLILTPHVAGITLESNRRVSATVAAAVMEVLMPAAKSNR